MPGLAGKGANKRSSWNYLVPGGGVEPPRYQVPADFESAASASSAIPALLESACYRPFTYLFIHKSGCNSRAQKPSSKTQGYRMRFYHPSHSQPDTLWLVHVLTDVCFERKRVQLETYRLLPLRPRHCGAGRVPPVFAFFSTRSFHAVRSAPVSTSSLAGGRWS